MCGISGFITNNSKINRTKTVLSMLKKIKHRGPDHTGIFNSKNFTGGYVRLSINDLNKGNQPFNFNTTYTQIIAFYNGEIYNFLDLKQKLIQKGYKFKTNCDGEIIPSLYNEFGENFVELLEGMFSISIWDSQKKKLLLFRDHLGEKPLYYSTFSKQIVFGSEVKAILAFPDLNRAINYQSLWDMPTFLWIPEPNTAFKNIRSLPPGSVLTFEKGNLNIKKYSNVHYSNYDESFDEKSLIKETQTLVSHVVKKRNISDAPVGCFLSSGIDSSLVAKISSNVNKNLRTYTVSFEDVKDPYHGGSIDESKDAKIFAIKLNLINSEIKANSENLKREFKFLIRKMDQPMAISSAIGISMVARRAKQDGVKVLLSGDGADEMFVGYDWYRYLDSILKYRNKSNESVGNISFQSIGNKNHKNFLRKISKYSSKKMAWAMHYYASEEDKKNLYSKDFSRGFKNSLRFFNDLKNNTTPIDFVNHDRKFYLTNEMLFKLDRCTMLHSVESRSPFTSPIISQLVKKIKFSQMLKNNKLKFLIKKSFSASLPNEIINRKKHGFNVPIDHYLKNQWSDMLRETFSENSFLFKKNLIDKKSILYMDKLLKSRNRLTGHTLLSFVAINSWLKNI